MSGGSIVSASLTCVRATFNVHDVFTGNVAVGRKVNSAFGDTLRFTSSRCAPAGHSSVNALDVTFTGSLKRTMMSAFRGADPPLAGTVAVTRGPLSSGAGGAGHPTKTPPVN